MLRQLEGRFPGIGFDHVVAPLFALLAQRTRRSSSTIMIFSAGIGD